VKRCAKAANPPPCFSDYQIENPDASWDQFRSTVDSCYHVLRAQLLADQGGLCAYCERAPIVLDQQVAHFHPKSDRSSARNWALHWPNLWLACLGGDQRKLAGDPEAFTAPPGENLSCDTATGDQVLDEIILAPDQIPAFPRIFRFEQHPDAILIVPDEPNCTRAGIDPHKVWATIRHLNLNCRRLTSARLTVHRVLQQEISKARREGCDVRMAYARLVTKHLAHSTGRQWRPFFTLRRWALRAPAEDYLNEVGFNG